MHASPMASQVVGCGPPNTEQAVEQGSAHVHTVLQSGGDANAVFNMMATPVAMIDKVRSVFMMYLMSFREIIVRIIRPAGKVFGTAHPNRKSRRFCICEFAEPNRSLIVPTSKNSWP